MMSSSDFPVDAPGSLMFPLAAALSERYRLEREHGAEGVHVVNRQKLFEGDYVLGDVHASWDVAPDGRLLVVNPLRNTQTIVVHDWRDGLQARLRSAH